MAKYTAKKGAPYGDEEAQYLGKVKDDAEAKHGVCKPDDIVRAARAKSSPIHRLFEWNNTKAAAEYRRLQASRYMGFLEITVRYTTVSGNRDTRQTRAAHKVTVALDSQHVSKGFVSTERIQKDSELASQVIKSIQRKLDRLSRQLVEYSGVFGIVVEAIATTHDEIFNDDEPPKTQVEGSKRRKR